MYLGYVKVTDLNNVTFNMSPYSPQVIGRSQMTVWYYLSLPQKNSRSHIEQRQKALEFSKV